MNMNKTAPFKILRTCLLATPLIFSLAGSVNAKSIGKDQVNIREQPNTNSPVLFIAPLGYPIKIVKESNGWVYFKDWQNNNGWVHKPLISNIDTAVIIVEKANIRSTSNTSGSVVANAEFGEIYTIQARAKNWVKLGYYESGATVGWIRTDLIFGH